MPGRVFEIAGCVQDADPVDALLGASVICISDGGEDTPMAGAMEYMRSRKSKHVSNGRHEAVDQM